MNTHNQNPAVDGLRAPAQAVLFKQVQAGCRACLNLLMGHHKGLVPFVVRRQTLGELSLSAATQAGRIGLWRAIVGYDMATILRLVALAANVENNIQSMRSCLKSKRSGH